MTKEDVIRMALEAGAKPSSNSEKWDILEISDESLERFAKLVAAHEREECAKIADNNRHNLEMLTSYPLQSGAARSISIAIRARGEK